MPSPAKSELRGGALLTPAVMTIVWRVWLVVSSHWPGCNIASQHAGSAVNKVIMLAQPTRHVPSIRPWECVASDGVMIAVVMVVSIWQHGSTGRQHVMSYPHHHSSAAFW